MLKLFKEYWKEILYALLLLGFYCVVVSQNLIYVDSYFYTDGVIEQYADRFSLPLFYFVGLVSFWLFGSITFIALPLVFFFMSYYLMVRLFKKHNYNTALIPLSFAIAPLFSESAWFFMRDNLFFLLATAFAYFFFKSHVEEKTYWKQLAVICMLMVLTRDISVVFLFLFFVLMLFKGNSSGLFATFINPDWASNWYRNWIYGLNEFINLFSKKITFVALFPNALWIVSGFSLLRKPSWIYFILIATSIFTSATIFSMGFDNSHLFRYTLSLFPLHLFFIANAEKDEKHKWAYGIFYSAAVIPFITFLKLGHF